MSTHGYDSPFLQLKIDYINFMVQIFNLMGYDEDTTGILFALLMENDYLSINHLKILTGESQSKISEILSRLTIVTGDFPILQTRKPGKRGKYYYCPSTFEDYIKRNFTFALTASKISLDFIPVLISRVNALPEQSAATQYVKKIFNFLNIAFHFYSSVILSSNDLLEQIFQDPTHVPDFKAIVKNAMASIPVIPDPPKIEDDNLTSIKKEFVDMMLDLSRELISGNEEAIKLFLVMYLENEPVTQEELCSRTSSSRGKMSQLLGNLVELKAIEVTKKTNDRKKYYKMLAPMQDYGSGKLIRVKQYYSQIDKMLQTKFIPDLAKIQAKSDKEKQEKEKFEKFLMENVKSFKILDNFGTILHIVIQDELKAYFTNL